MRYERDLIFSLRNKLKKSSTGKLVGDFYLEVTHDNGTIIL